VYASPYVNIAQEVVKAAIDFGKGFWAICDCL